MPATSLVVAPRPKELYYADKEVQEIVNFLDAKLLLGDVNHRELMEEFRKGYDWIFFPTHMTEEGLLLSEDPPIYLQATTLTQYLRHAPPELIALNTCNSLLVAADLVEDLETTVVCTTIDIPDLQAYTTLAQLAYYLSIGHTVSEAYKLSKPGMNREYRLISSAGGGERLDRVIDAIEALREEQERTSRRLGRVQEEQEDTNGRLASLEESTKYSVRLAPRWPMLWWAYGSFLMILAMAYVDVRSWLSFSWQASFAVSSLLVPAVGALLLAGLGIQISNINNHAEDQEP